MINISGDTGGILDGKKIENAVRAVFNNIEREKIVNISFISSKEIKGLNRKYGGKNESTDVLSFNYGEEGDVALNLSNIESGDEIKTLIHGVLHLFGYDHEKVEDYDIMKKKEEEIIRSIEE